MNKEKYTKIISECSKYLPEINEFLLSLSFNIDIITFLDTINEFIHTLKQNGKISNSNFENLLFILTKYYEKDCDYVQNRIDWINELRKDENKLSLKEHQKELINLFDILNNVLNTNDIEYFHASGFLCYLLTNNSLERYHHDIDLYININDIYKMKKIFNREPFKMLHTYEKSGDKTYRCGYKIETSLNNIPIWLNFYEKMNDGSIYIQEYYQENNGNYFTMENYNSPKCCNLSLSKGEYDKTNYISLSLEALYLSKMGNRKKDVYDCKIINQFIDYEKIILLKQELTDSWNKKEGIPFIIEETFKSEFEKEKKDDVKLTKKRI